MRFRTVVRGGLVALSGLAVVLAGPATQPASADPTLDELRTLLPDDLRPDAAPAVDWPATPSGQLEPPVTEGAP